MLPRRFQRGIAFSVILAAGIYLALILYSGGFADLREALSRFPWWGVPVACGLASVNWLLRFVKWERYRQLLGVRITRRQSMLVYFSGFCLSITPGKMGEAYKSILIKRLDGSPISRTAMIVVAERLTDLLALVILMGAGGVWTILRGQHLSGAAEGPDYGRYVGWVAIGTLLFVAFCSAWSSAIRSSSSSFANYRASSGSRASSTRWKPSTRRARPFSRRASSSSQRSFLWCRGASRRSRSS